MASSSNPRSYINFSKPSFSYPLGKQFLSQNPKEDLYVYDTPRHHEYGYGFTTDGKTIVARRDKERKRISIGSKSTEFEANVRGLSGAINGIIIYGFATCLIVALMILAGIFVGFGYLAASISSAIAGTVGGGVTGGDLIGLGINLYDYVKYSSAVQKTFNSL